jgi:hypothetical protein
MQFQRRAAVRVAGEVADIRAQGGVWPAPVMLEAVHLPRLKVPWDKRSARPLEDDYPAEVRRCQPDEVESGCLALGGQVLGAPAERHLPNPGDRRAR